MAKVPSGKGAVDGVEAVEDDGVMVGSAALPGDGVGWLGSGRPAQPVRPAMEPSASDPKRERRPIGLAGEGLAGSTQAA